MDRSLDDIVSDRQRGPPRRNGRYDDRPRDPPRKTRDAPRDLDRDWVHDRYEVDDYSRPAPRDTRPPPRGSRLDRYEPENDRPVDSSAKLRVDNVHYELYENDLKELFERIGPVLSVQILYDRSDRSKGIAYITYASRHDAQRALRDYDGANAYGQPISLTLMPTGPAAGRGAGGSGGAGRSLDERITAPERSLFDRIEGGGSGRGGRSGAGRDDGRGVRGRRSESPRDRERERMRRADGARSAPEGIDRYVPGGRDDRRRDRDRSRSPMRREADRRDGGGRGGRGGRRGDDRRADRGPRPEGEGRGTRGGRPRKTADELDAEMEDYWGGAGSGSGTAGDVVQADESAGGAAAAERGIAAEPVGGGGAVQRDDLDDVDMIE